MRIGIDIGGTIVVVGTVPEDGRSVHGVISERTYVGEDRTGTINQLSRMLSQSIDATAEELGAGSICLDIHVARCVLQYVDLARCVGIQRDRIEDQRRPGDIDGPEIRHGVGCHHGVSNKTQARQRRF